MTGFTAASGSIPRWLVIMADTPGRRRQIRPRLAGQSRCRRRASVPSGQIPHEPEGMNRVERIRAAVHPSTQRRRSGRSTEAHQLALQVQRVRCAVRRSGDTHPISLVIACARRRPSEQGRRLIHQVVFSLFRPPFQLRATRDAVPRLRRGPALENFHRLAGTVCVARFVVAVPCRSSRHWRRPANKVAVLGAVRQRPQRTDRRPRRHIPMLPSQRVLRRAIHAHPRSQLVLQRQLQGGTGR